MRIPFPFSRSILVTLFLSLAACTYTQHQSQLFHLQATSPKAHQQALSELTQWSLQGKIALRHNNHNQQSINRSARLHWQQNQQQYTVQINGPIGTSSGKIVGDDKQATLYSSHLEQPLQTSQPEQTLYQELGWRIPLHQLQHWVIGQANLGTIRNAQFNPDHSLKSFNFLSESEQQNWYIEYSNYQWVGTEDTEKLWWLPTKVTLESKTSNIRLLVKDWLAQ